MEARREELKRRIQEANKNPWIAGRYDGALKRAVTEYGRERQKEGATVAEIARELGLGARTCERWLRRARLQINAGKTPFEPRRRRAGTGDEAVKHGVDGASADQPGEGARPRTEKQLEPSEERILILLVKVPEVQVENVTREQLCEWLRGPNRAAPTGYVARERGR